MSLPEGRQHSEDSVTVVPFTSDLPPFSNIGSATYRCSHEAFCFGHINLSQWSVFQGRGSPILRLVCDQVIQHCMEPTKSRPLKSKNTCLDLSLGWVKRCSVWLSATFHWTLA
ncbi:hypothetical protein ILYODFUR_032158 [Ilyodon furcidens]|uniref:Uncharacterized protein n=1 Tax=Ilyodon furcidens TaxID=33524 RepID=A0ABV0TGP9_9TELE